MNEQMNESVMKVFVEKSVKKIYIKKKNAMQHMTCDMSHMTLDRWGEVNPSSYGLVVKVCYRYLTDPV